MSDELPKGWACARISEVTERVPNIKPENSPNKEFGYVDISSIDNSRFVITDVKSIKGQDAPSRARRPIRPNDVIFSNVRTYLRNIAVVGPDCGAEVCSTGFTVLRPNAAVEPRFLFRYVLTDQFLDRVTPQQTGTHYPATSDKVVMSEAIPLPPLAEQRRIVAKLEKLSGQVDACQQRLEKLPTLLKRFRQSVLAAACSGRLTADWREENDDVESSADLLQKILDGRNNRYEAMCAKCIAGGDKPPKRPKNLTQGKITHENLPDIPRTWEWVCWDDLADWITYGFTRPMPHVRKGVPIITAKNVRDGFLDFSRLEFTTKEAFAELSDKDKPRRNEILITKDGAIRGRAALVETDEPFCISQAVAVVRFGGLTADEQFLLHVV